ncbi:hypothetical protein KR50_32030 [Jeotgalibacillus campisalis]|uniref:Uncharacterized protein n=1 Tax=Jeotgalibacillus campisalis TaxID=220754 RepID=A0A0C2VI41_9BACL|nr:hypothetical protein KR50_32030 [Jeotgalibacillus campisalis]
MFFFILSAPARGYNKYEKIIEDKKEVIFSYKKRTFVL